MSVRTFIKETWAISVPGILTLISALTPGLNNWLKNAAFGLIFVGTSYTLYRKSIKSATWNTVRFLMSLIAVMIGILIIVTGGIWSS